MRGRRPSAVFVVALGAFVVSVFMAVVCLADRIFGEATKLFMFGFALVAAISLALVFDSLAGMAIESELKSGREVLAAWRAPESRIAASLRPRVSPRARALVWIGLGASALALTGGAFVWPQSRADLSEIGAVVLALIGLMALGSWFNAGRLSKARSGEIIIGPRGALISGRLFAWSAPMISLRGARDAPEQSEIVLTIRQELRRGHMEDDLAIPYPPEASQEIAAVVAQLNALAQT